MNRSEDRKGKLDKEMQEVVTSDSDSWVIVLPPAIFALDSLQF